MNTLTIISLISLSVWVGVLLNKNNKKMEDADSAENKKKLVELEKELLVKTDLLKSEENKRTDLTKNLETQKNEALTPEEIADFFNDNK